MHRASAAPLQPAVDPDALLAWRQRSVAQLLRLMLLFGVPLVLIDSLLLLSAGRWQGAIYNFLGLILVAGVAAAPQLDFRGRGAALVALLVGSGLFGLCTRGIDGINTVMLVVSVMIAVLLLGPRAGLAAAAIIAVAVALIFAGFGLGLLAYPGGRVDAQATPAKLALAWLLLIGLGSVPALIASSLLRALERSLESTRAAVGALERLNSSLETSVERRTAELRRTGAFLQRTQELARVGGWVYGHAGTAVEWTEGLYAIHAVPSGTPVDLGLLQRLYPGDSWPQIAAAFRRLIADGTPYDLELPAVTLDGREIWVRVYTAATTTDTGARQYIGAVQDVTQRKEVERLAALQLRYAEALARCSQILLVEGQGSLEWQGSVGRSLAALRGAIGCGRLGIYIYTVPTAILDLPALAVADQDPAAPPHREIPVAMGDIPTAYIETIAAGGWVAGVPERLFAADSSARRYCEVNAIGSLLVAGLHVGGLWRGYIAATDRSAEYGWSEATIGLVQTGLDMIGAFLQQWEVTATLRTREALLHTVQARQDALLHAIPDLLIGVSAAGEVRFVHAPPSTPLPVPTDALGQPIDRVLPPALAAELTAALARPGDAPPLITVSTGLAQSDTAQTFEGRVMTMGDDEALVIVRDITDQRRLQASLEQARDAAEAAARAKSSFLASMSHEIRTPLNAVIGMAGLLQGTALTAEQRVFAETISTGGQALLAVISDILDFSRIESGRLDLDAEPFEPRASLRATVDLVEHAARAKGLAVHCELAPSLPPAVVGDAGRLRQVLLNLLGNAVKFTSHGSIALSADASPQGAGDVLLRVSVRDTGIGMSPAQLERIFEPFVQADTSTSRRYGGTGLGLAISQQLVALMGGVIDVASAPGAGSTFTVIVPMATAPLEDLPQAVEPAPHPPGALLVLVAEDNPINQEVTRRLVEGLGHTVTVVADGAAAVEAVRVAAYDVVLMDVQMPGLDGESATRQIRQLGPGVRQPRIVALTANALAGDRERFLAAGMDDYLSKPVMPAELAAAFGRRPEAAPAPAAAPPAEPLIDWGAIAHLGAALDAPTATASAMALRLLESTIPTQLAALEAAIGAADGPLVRLEAHRLRGGSLQLGARAMAALCTRIEQAGPAADLRALAADLRDCYAQTCATLRERPPPP